MVQDKLLEHSKSVYLIGNWGDLKHKYTFKTAESMKMKSNSQGKELISGLLNHKFIQKAYQL